jgi:benzoyl-CoA reductase/2-hydroxyglutaryl-CoA dehydratase subunit BcrC/BadD/HgdB
VKSAEPARKSLRPRLILTGAPAVWPNFKVLNLLEECGADVVADTLCTGAQCCFDPVVIDEKSMQSLLRALANRYVYAAICPCFISQTTRINRILDLREEMKADGVVNYSLRLCQLFDIENYRIGRTLKARKIPFLNVRTDYSLEDTEQLRVRIEAFLETL